MAYVAPTVRSVGDAVTAADYNIVVNDLINLRGLANVVQGTYSTATICQNTTYITTNLAATITPTSNTSKIKISYSIYASKNSGDASNAVNLKLYVGATPIEETERIYNLYTATATTLHAVVSDVYLHSPATTSATTYTVYFACGVSGTNCAAVHNYNADAVGHIILQEIPA